MSRFSTATFGLLLALAVLKLDFAAPQVTTDVVKVKTTETIKPTGEVVTKVKTTSFSIVNGRALPVIVEPLISDDWWPGMHLTNHTK
jgi:hypothetical protein